ncbi:uncharacterized protein CLUP02_07609 [Colletotrichum lupini]|uniref:Uncharacterized protein n=1 Tax=Colletotrichum lupini TaxID=145971 RepID=A0A9Q8SRI0_9PEZI|nr:uncharacterized protein CLUP02_07609 [Colletotrichum lupini]UQC82123.1 hypothetical protein CLUP02_07609 [Colletotrichum lupini]
MNEVVSRRSTPAHAPALRPPDRRRREATEGGSGTSAGGTFLSFSERKLRMCGSFLGLMVESSRSITSHCITGHIAASLFRSLNFGASCSSTTQISPIDGQALGNFAALQYPPLLSPSPPLADIVIANVKLKFLLLLMTT